MKRAPLFILIACNVTWAFPATARAQVAVDTRDSALHAAVGPLARSAAREAARLASVREPATLMTGDAQQADDSAADWLGLGTLAPGTELVVTATGTPAVERVFLARDASTLTVLNLTNPSLDRSTKNALRTIAMNHAEYFQAARTGQQFLVLEKNVRVTPAGVFVSSRKIADLEEMVNQYARSDVAEIKTARTSSNPVACALVGYYGGGLVGGFPGAIIGGYIGRDTGPTLAGMMVGWSAGAVLVYNKCRHKPERVMYRSP